jgi:putative photosynthetic complex assembly protein 2
MSASELIWPALFVLLVWWISTGIILFLDQLPTRTYPVSMAGNTAVGVGALMMLALASHHTTETHAYISFTCAILIWGWQEMAFLMGYVTGPSKAPCPLYVSETKRFRAATEAVIHHELALALTTLVLFAASWKQPNQVGAWTFFALWVLRLSAKLNLFLGVRNRYESFLPPHLAYLATFFGKRSINLLFPVVVTAGSVVAYQLWLAATASAVPFDRVGLALVATIVTLGVLEHWLLVMPLPVERLWGWAASSDKAAKRV